MKRSLIVHAPQGAGKTRNGARIAKHFGLFEVIEADGVPSFRELPRFGALILTNDAEVAEALGESGRFDMMTLGAALDAVDGTGFHTTRDPASIVDDFARACNPSAGIAGGFLSPESDVANDRVEVAAELPRFNLSETNASGILNLAAMHLDSRASLRDKPEGERSMARTVTAFNALTGHKLSERDGWAFMIALKLARACNTETGIPDDYQDGAAYFALAGECAVAMIREPGE